MTELSRRHFVTACCSATLTLMASSCASLAARQVFSENGVIRLPLRNHPELSSPGGSLKIRPDESSEVLYVMSVGNGEFSVLSPICTHRGCTVELAGERLVCPCHGSTYDRKGAVLRGPAERALASVPTSVESGDVLVIRWRR